VHKELQPAPVNHDVAEVLTLLRREVGVRIKSRLQSLRDWVIQDGQEPAELLEEDHLAAYRPADPEAVSRAPGR
jgi:hypothetical protein